MNDDADNSKVLSGSAAIKAHLMTKPEGFQFTCAQLQAELPEISSGAISGFVAKLKVANIIESYGSNLGAANYRLIGDIASHYVRPTAPKTATPRATFGLPDIVLRLTEAMAIIETYKTPLTAYSDSELLNELNRRAKARTAAEQETT